MKVLTMQAQLHHRGGRSGPGSALETIALAIQQVMTSLYVGGRFIVFSDLTVLIKVFRKLSHCHERYGQHEASLTA